MQRSITSCKPSSYSVGRWDAAYSRTVVGSSPDPAPPKSI